MSALDPFDVHVVSHTHWDREWYLPLARFRQRLVALIDELLDTPPRRSAFLLDGQGILLDDYLAVRPEREPALRAALASGVLEAGPWYVLADELLTSGEALVRNLLAGGRAVRARGGRPPSVLYCPDSFGHPADLPTLAEGFGLPLIILWRGLGGPEWPHGDAYWWRARGGARVLLHHLPPPGYEYGANLPADAPAANERWRALRALLVPRARTSTLLVLNGADHHARQSGLEEAIDALARAAAPDRVRASTLGAFAASFVEHAKARTTDLPEIEGELRYSPAYTWTVPGTWSSRAYQKRRNAGLERLLTREAEVWASIAAARGAPSRAPLLRAAWRTLLECHPHDTLCGCSADEVAMAADGRFAVADAEARGIVEDAVHELVGHDAVAARSAPHWSSYILVRNAAARARGGIAEIDIARVIAREPVGPGSAGVSIPEGELAPPALDGGRVPLQVLERRVRSDRVESPRHYPHGDRVEVSRCIAWVDEIPGYGVSPLAVEGRLSGGRRLPVNPVRGTARSLDNGILRVKVDDAGGIELDSVRHGRVFGSIIRLEDVGDAGDLYTHSSIEPIVRNPQVREIRLTYAGPLRAQLRVKLVLDVPVSSNRAGRSRKTVSSDIELRLTLDAGASFLRVGVRGKNRARDHRLRICFATDTPEGITVADGMFGPVQRPVRIQPTATRSTELIPQTAPLARWVSRRGATHGMTLISDGLGEYEVFEDGAIAVTLVRAVGALSRNDLPERPGHAGWPVPTPGAQCIGGHRAEFALLPHGPEENVVTEIERAADDVLLPLRGWTLRSATGALEVVPGLSLEGEGLRFLACKPSDDGEWTVLRCVNVTSHSVSGSWKCSWPVREARSSRLDEQAGTAVSVRDESIVDVRVAPLATTTILVR